MIKIFDMLENTERPLPAQGKSAFEILKAAAAVFCLAAALLGSPGAASACTCDPKDDLEQALEKASLVFVGQVKSKSENPLRKEQWEVRFTVSRKLKGFEEVPGSSVLVYTPADHEYCGFKFQEGLDYLVFASGTPAHYQTTTCSRSDVLDNVLTDVHKLIRLTGNVDTRGK